MENNSLTNFSKVDILDVLPALTWMEIPQFVYKLEITYLVFIALVGIPGNSLILILQLRNREKSSTDYLVMTMAGFELWCSSVNNTVKILKNIPSLWASIASPRFCQLHYCSSYITTLASTWSLGAIAIDRYIKTCKPLTANYTLTTAKRICMGVSIAGVIGGFPPMITFTLDNYLHCLISEVHAGFMMWWDNAMIFTILVEFFVFIFAYANIGIALRKRHRVRVLAHVQPSDVSEPHNTLRAEFTIQTILSKTNKVGIGKKEHSANIADNHNPEEMMAGAKRPSCERTSDQTQAIRTAVNQKLQLAEQMLNRTTRIMFLLTVVYLVIWSVVCTATITKKTGTVFGSIVDKLSETLFMLNCISNPLLFFCMSSKYRSDARKLFSRRT